MIEILDPRYKLIVGNGIRIVEKQLIYANVENNAHKVKGGIYERYVDAPDLAVLPKNAWRFINAVSDYATHAEPIRRTKNYRDNLFAKTIDGHPMIDKALKLVRSA